MSDIILRAEQGVLGALLAASSRDDQAFIFATLTVDDFAHPTHQALFAALSDLRFNGCDTDRLADAAAQAGIGADVTPAWLATLAKHAPSPAHVRAYTSIVLAAAFDRDTADFADHYLAAAELETDAETRLSLLRTGQALQLQAVTFSTASLVSPDTTVVTVSVVAERDLTREDMVIADVLQHPRQAQKVAAWLTSDVFTTEQRRLAFEITISHAYHGDPVDPVIVAWELERARAVNAYHQRQTAASTTRDEPDLTYLTRLAVTAVVTGTAITVGHQLVSEHTAATLALSASAAIERQAAAAAARQVHQPLLQPPPLPATETTLRPRIEL
jgi:replicative DNA helicase